MKKLLALVCAAAVALGLPGCGQKAESTPTSSLPQDAVLPLVDQADPEQAMEAIYAEVEIRDVQQADDQILLEKFFIDPSQLESYTVWYTSGLYGIADVFILKPLPGEGEQELAILREHPRNTGIFHCYSGSVESLREVLDLGWSISIGGVVTFKNARVLREVAAAVPADRLMLETDSPYLAPTPDRGKRNAPLYLPEIAAEIAALRGITPEEVERITDENALRMFKMA